MISSCIWKQTQNNEFITGCNQIKIQRNNYIGEYCPICGRKIIFPTFIDRTIWSNVNYAN